LHRHRWRVSQAEAIRIQEHLRDQVITDNDLSEVHTVAALDSEHRWFRQKTKVRVFLFSYPELKLLEMRQASTWMPFPYERGLLSFAAAPAALAALAKLKTAPDLLICDGHGIAHPRRFGLASHLGVLSGIASIGMAQRLLVGHHEPVPMERGAWRPVVEDGEVLGAALRARTGGRLVYVSSGHRVALESAVSYVLDCTIAPHSLASALEAVAGFTAMLLAEESAGS
jgi:deoxyribonuclease V